MYEMFFELMGRPFPSTPDTTAYFPAAAHQEALELLKTAWKEGEAFGLLVGAPGTGKTLLCHRLLDDIEPKCSFAYVSGLNDTSCEALLLALLHDLSLPTGAASEQGLRITLMDFLVERFASGGSTTLFIDEAQNLSPAQLEELRILTNLESQTKKAVQVLLFGQERLGEVLQVDALAPLRQRIAVHARLAPLSDEEVTDYVRAHIARVGGSADSIFTASALSEICEYSGGIPRRINQIGHRSLSLAYAQQSGTIDGEIIHLAASHLQITKPTDRIEHHHLPTAGSPRRIVSDLAFNDLHGRGPHSSSSEFTSVTSQMTVLEVGAEDPWGSIISEDPKPSSDERKRAGEDPSTVLDSTKPVRTAARWRDEFERHD